MRCGNSGLPWRRNGGIPSGLASIALEVASTYGLALAGGHAVNAHGFVSRPSADVDLFGALDLDLDAATSAVIGAYRAAGLDVNAEHVSRYYVRLMVTDAARRRVQGRARG